MWRALVILFRLAKIALHVKSLVAMIRASNYGETFPSALASPHSFAVPPCRLSSRNVA
jgi:hypothetical protein